MRSMSIVISLFLLLPFFALADVSSNDDEKPKITPYGYLDYELGQIVRGRFLNNLTKDTTVYHTWLQNIHGRLGLRYQPLDWLSVNIGAEIRMWFNTFPPAITELKNVPRSKYWSIYLHEAQGIIKLLDNESLLMNMAIGYFPYKYNPEVRNLGEYLFRTGTYPVYIINYYDLPLARLAGLRYSLNYKHDVFGLKFDLLGLTEMEMWPYHDFTLASILDFNILKNEEGNHSIINIGAGISFAHLIPVDDSMTTPAYKDYSTYACDSTFKGLDSLNDSLWSYEKSYYTFKGTKLMARATLDPVAFLRDKDNFWGDLFGQYGGKIYGELAIIGLKNYPANAKHDTIIGSDTIEVGFADTTNGNPYGYSDITERMPFMFGITIPCWKILDICAIEVEYFKCPYPNDYERVYTSRFPIPGRIYVNEKDSSYTYEFYKNKGDWKWTVFMKKNIGDHIGIILQICRDHQRWEFSGHSGNWDFEEAMVKKNHWAWNFKTEFKF